ncbi:hypothetical protein [Methanosarcina sp. MTP4]|uniref:hypothetical protein n=1 Tax=Methanosarcina sp. MTP4 TaxID=1434100 RepID=UPI00064F799E|nr:hypothetical protein [Methanosarcina sp. MTP4]
MRHISILVLVLVLLACSFVGCIDEAGIVVVQDRCESSFDLSKGIVYHVDLWVQNEGSVSKSSKVTAELLVENTGEVRDSETQIVNLEPGETKQITLVLDGERNIDYEYTYYVDGL